MRKYFDISNRAASPSDTVGGKIIDSATGRHDSKTGRGVFVDSIFTIVDLFDKLVA